MVGWQEYDKARKEVKTSVQTENTGIWGGVVNKTNEVFDGETKRMLIETNRVMGNQGEKIGKGIATLRTENGKMVSSSKGEREVLEEHYHRLRTPALDKRSNVEFEKEINACATANVEALNWED